MDNFASYWQFEKCNVRNLENGFVLRAVEYDNLKTALKSDMAEVWKLVPAELETPEERENFLKAEFMRPHGLNDAAVLPNFSQLLVESLVPQKIRHLLHFQEWHFLGKRQFSKEIFSIFKCELYVYFFILPSFLLYPFYFLFFFGNETNVDKSLLTFLVVLLM
jgi:hypothetical protein